MKALSEFLTQTVSTSAFRVAAISIAFFVAIAAIIAGLVFRETTRTLRDQVLTAIDAEIQVLNEVAAKSGRDGLVAAIKARTAAGAGLYLLKDSRRRTIAGNLSAIPVELQSKNTGGTFRYQPAGTGQPSTTNHRRAVARPVDVIGMQMFVGRDIENQAGALRDIWLVFLTGLAGLAVAGAGIGLWMSHRLVARVDDMTSASQRIMAGDLSQRVPQQGTGDELDGLAHSLNEMLARIEQLMAGLREVSDNIAHDLKTPLNRLRNRAEAALRDQRGPEAHREGLELTIESADQLISTFNALLLIAKLEAGAIEETLRPIDLGAVVEDVSEFYAPAAEEAGLTFVSQSQPGLIASANKQLVGQAIANLIDNAIKYSASSGNGPQMDRELRVAVAQSGQMIEISVSDQGAGIAKSDRERALQRFVRLEKSRTAPGTGLGLSLVAAVARLHKGNIRLEDNEPGLRAVLALPRLDETEPEGNADVATRAEGAPALSTGS